MEQNNVSINKKIIILGNGFDLACNLKTSYDDFFEMRRNDKKIQYNNFRSLFNIETNKESLNNFHDLLKDNNEIFYNHEKNDNKNRIIIHNNIDGRINNLNSEIYRELKSYINSDINVWDLIFWYLEIYEKKSNILWSDVENIIEEIVTNNSKNIKINFFGNSDFDTMSDLKNITITTNKFHKALLLSTYNYNLAEIWDYLTQQNKIAYLLSEFYNINNEVIKEEDAFDFLIEELIKFENIFREYICNIMNIVNHNRTLQKLYRNNLMKLFETKECRNVYLLNFNYTGFDSLKEEAKNNITTIQRDNIFYNIEECNVHGVCNKITIFGIDQDDKETLSSNYIFTKTYRKMQNQNSVQSSNIPIKSDVDEIIFYGHSLAKADYSYFQSIFDYYDIYHSDIKLTFQYSIYNKDKRKQIEKKQMSSISNLLSSYGASMDNKNHGKNLIHKLILENRLKIDVIELKSIYNMTKKEI